MATVTIGEAKDRLSELAELVEEGETVVVTRDGRPIFDLVPHQLRKRGIDWDAGRQYKRKHGIERFVEHISADFDAPLPDDFLLRPLPE